ncbi:MAG TPA: glutathione peroxidase [Saprospiraceae bacterium]|nr:glutathione peroxidase [Saprospiraceae bacterium]
MASIHYISIEGINGNELRLDQFRGKKLMIVNVASECDYTPQYEQLEELYRHYYNKLSIIGCPSNDFGNQEPENEDKILSFCQTMFQVTFPLSKKINIRSTPVHPLYQWLTDKTLNEVSDNKVTWNFQKFAIGPDGDWQKVFSPETSPLDDQIIDWIEST